MPGPAPPPQAYFGYPQGGAPPQQYASPPPQQNYSYK